MLNVCACIYACVVAEGCKGDGGGGEGGLPHSPRSCSHLFQELLADELTPLDAELDLAARVAQVCSVQHQLQQHVSVPPACQIRLLRMALAESIQQPHVLSHVCRQDCIHNQAASLQASAKSGCLQCTW